MDYNAAMRVLNAQYAVQINERLRKFGYNIVAGTYSFRYYKPLVYTHPMDDPILAECDHQLALFVVNARYWSTISDNGN